MNKEWFLEKSNGRDLQGQHMGIRRGQRSANPRKLGEEGENSHVQLEARLQIDGEAERLQRRGGRVAEGRRMWSDRRG